MLILGTVWSDKSSLVNAVGCKQFLLYICMHDLVNSILILGEHMLCFIAFNRVTFEGRTKAQKLEFT